MDIAVLGVDLGKNVCSVVGLDASGAVVMRRKVRRETLIALAEKLPPCVVGMEACCGAHHLGRVFAAHGRPLEVFARWVVESLVRQAQRALVDRAATLVAELNDGRSGDRSGDQGGDRRGAGSGGRSDDRFAGETIDHIELRLPPRLADAGTCGGHCRAHD
jgi:transposase